MNRPVAVKPAAAIAVIVGALFASQPARAVPPSGDFKVFPLDHSTPVVIGGGGVIRAMLNGHYADIDKRIATGPGGVPPGHADPAKFGWPQVRHTEYFGGVIYIKGKGATSQDIVDVMSAHGVRPASAAECLAFGIEAAQKRESGHFNLRATPFDAICLGGQPLTLNGIRYVLGIHFKEDNVVSPHLYRWKTEWQPDPGSRAFMTAGTAGAAPK